MKDKSKIQVADKVTGNLVLFEDKIKAKIQLLTTQSVKCVSRRERKSRRFAVLVLLFRVQLEQYFILKIQLVELTSRKRLPAGHNGMLHMADVRCAGDL